MEIAMHNMIRRGVFLGLVLALTTTAVADEQAADLIQALKAQEESARLEAVDQLGAMREKAAEAVPALTKLLADDSAAVRAHAADALGKIGPAAKPAAPALIELMTDPDDAVCRQALEALRQIRPGPEVGIPAVTKVLTEASPAMQVRALHALAEIGPEVVPFLIEALAEEDAVHWACIGLQEIGPEAKDAVPALIEALDDPRLDVRREVTLALAAIGEAAAPAIPKLVVLLDDELRRVPATYALGSIGGLPPDVEAKIRANCKSDDAFLRTISHWAIARLHPDDKAEVRTAVAMMLEVLKSDDPRACSGAVQCLIDLDAGPEIMLPAIEETLEDADEETAKAVLDTMAASAGPEAVPRLLNALKHKGVRPYAAYILGQLGPAAKPAVGALADMLDDESPEAQREALFALAEIGAEAKAAVPAIARLIEEREGPICYGACYALGRIGPAATEAKPCLLEQLAGDDEFLPLVSAWALARIDPESAETAAKTVPILIGGLQAELPKERFEAAATLKLLGPLAKPAAEALRKAAAEDEDEQVRRMAAEALKSTGG